MPRSQTVFRKSILAYLVGSVLALTLLVSFFWYFAKRSLPNVNAQIGQVTTVIENASTPITGGWQASVDNSDSDQYRLWSYKTYGTDRGANSYPSRVFCYWYRVPVYDTDEDGNEFPVNISDMTFGGQTYRQTQTFNNDEGTSTVENVVRGAVTIEVNGKQRPDLNPYRSRCEDLNVNPLENNLLDRNNYLARNVPSNALDWGWMTRTDPVTWPYSPSTISGQKPFLVLGNNATGGGGFTNRSLDLNLWIPEDLDIQQALKLTTANLCDNTAWDANGDYAEISIYLRGQAGSEKIIDESDCGNTEHLLTGITDLKKNIGEPFEKRSLTALSGTKAQDQLYKHYKIKAEIDLGTNTDKHYINQFSLDVSAPSNTYLGIGQTEKDRGGDYISTTALSVSNRLPDEYDRLEIFWQTDIYLAADASKGCSGEETKNIGFYDSDYPKTEIWRHYVGKNPNMQPEVDIYSADRNKFLNGEISKINTPEDTLFFDGKQDGRDVSQDEWEYEEFTFEYDKVYELRFRNIDQRTWIQIGLPFDQINALQKCIDKPLVKVYQSDVSVGGRFGSGINVSNCRDDDLSLANPAASIYAHGLAGLKGSSGEYAVYARGAIDAFYSKFKRGQDPPPDPMQELTFANNDANFIWGGHWGGQQRCMPNYWRQVQHLESPLPEANLNLANLAQNSETYYRPPLPDEVLSLSAPSNDLDLKAAVYVEGDLLITSDIINDNADMKQFNEIQSIYLIVQGDIFIDPAVTQIDALLVAMPSDGKNHSQEGRIYTCYLDNLSAVDSVNLDSLRELQRKTSSKRQAENVRYARECVEQLVINGALIARRIHLGRTTSSDSNSLGYATYPVAEEVYLRPEYFIGTPQLPPHSDWFYKSDSVTILPVNF